MRHKRRFVCFPFGISVYNLGINESKNKERRKGGFKDHATTVQEREGNEREKKTFIRIPSYFSHLS